MIRLTLCSLLTVTVALTEPVFAQEAPDFRVRDGYAVTAASEPLDEARFMEFGPNGDLYVSAPRAGEIYTLRDSDGDGVYEKAAVFVNDKKLAHGMHYYDGWLWFAQSQGIHRGRDTDGDGVMDEIVTIFEDGELPGGKGHWWRPVFVTEDGFYTSVGDEGNITDDLETDRMKLWFYSHDGETRKFIAGGIRNTEKYRFRPGTDELWGIDHNSDWYGEPMGENRDQQAITDYNPPCELNLYVEGGFYGHPYFLGNRQPRLEYMEKEGILDLAEKTIPPAWNFAAHAAPNGFCFIDGSDHLPADHQGDLFAASHGSWNRTIKVGYSVDRILFDDQTGKPYGMLRIVSCLPNDNVHRDDRDSIMGRPVDCVQAPDGTVLFSCDFTNRIYRIAYTGGDSEVDE